jgi:hypothetical protein
MAEDEGQGAGAMAVDDGQIRVAQAAARNLDEDFAVLRGGEFNLLDLDRAGGCVGALGACFAQDGGFHLHRAFSNSVG